MKIKELIANLQKFDPNCDVVLSSDDEGNSYRLLSTISDNSSYQKEGCEVLIGIQNLTPDLIKMGYTEEDVLDGKPCIILS